MNNWSMLFNYRLDFKIIILEMARQYKAAGRQVICGMVLAKINDKVSNRAERL